MAPEFFSHFTDLPVKKEGELPQKVGILTPQRHGLQIAVENGLKELGIDCVQMHTFDPSMFVDRLLLIGPMDHHFNQIQSLKPYKGQLPPATVWFTEQIPHATPLTREVSILRHQADFVRFAHQFPGNRFRRIGELLKLHSLTDTTVHTFSETNTRFLGKLGLKAFTTPWGYYKELGTLQERSDDREIDAIFIGNTLKPRGNMIEVLRKQMEAKGINLVIHDGDKYEDYLDGAERTRKLNNTKIMLAIPQQNKWDDIHFRLLLAGANGVMAVSPHILSSSQGIFEPGKDFVMAPVESLPDAVEYFLAHPEERQIIADNCHRKVMNLPLTSQLKQVLTTV